MASNGVILLNLSNRNAADFQRLEVPDSYEKASGALTAGTYVTVYKWLYQGFMMAPSLCDAVDADDHINLVDRTNGGILEVYPDDTIEIPSEPEPGPGPGPEPEPGTIVHDDPYYRKAVKVYTKTGVEGKIFIENGTTVGDGNLKTFVGDGIEVEISASSLVGYQPGVYAVPGICIIQHGGTAPNGDWYFTSIADMNIYSPTLSTPWTYVGPGHSVTQGWPDDGSETDFYYVFEHRNTNPGSASDVTLVPLSVIEDGQYDPEDYDANGFSSVDVNVDPDQIVTPGFYVQDRMYLEDNKVWGLTYGDRYIKPLSAGQDVIPDWRDPFEIGILFSYSGLMSRSQVLIGAIDGFYYAPTIELGKLGNIWAGITSGGSTWDYSLSISPSELEASPNQQIFVLLSSSEGVMTLSAKAGDNIVTKSIEISTPYFNNKLIEIGGINHSNNHCASNITFDLSGTYIKQNDEVIWGIQSTTI